MTDAKQLTEGEFEVLGFEPVPPLPRECRKGQSKYPFGRLEVGQAMLVKRGMRTVRSALSSHAKRTSDGYKFTCRKVDDLTTKVWRVS